MQQLRGFSGAAHAGALPQRRASPSWCTRSTARAWRSAASLVALLENHQLPGGGIRVPEALALPAVRLGAARDPANAGLRSIAGPRRKGGRGSNAPDSENWLTGFSRTEGSNPSFPPVMARTRTIQFASGGLCRSGSQAARRWPCRPGGQQHPARCAPSSPPAPRPCAHPAAAASPRPRRRRRSRQPSRKPVMTEIAATRPVRARCAKNTTATLIR